MRILQIVFLLSVCGCPQALRLPITDVLEVAKLSEDVTIDLLKMFQRINEEVGPSPTVTGKRALLNKFKVFNNKTNMFNSQLEGSQVLMAIVNYTDIQLELKFKLMEANENIEFIYVMYGLMGTLLGSKPAYRDPKLEQFARTIVSYSNSSIHSALDRINAIIAPEEDEDGDPSVFKILMQIMKEPENEMFCNIQTSWQQFHLKLYNALALTELKGFLLMEFSYMLLKLHKKGNFAKEMLTVQKLYKERSETTLKLTIEAVQAAPLGFWKCDPLRTGIGRPKPTEFIKDETYIEITELLQGYIENEMDESRKMGPCFGRCDTNKERNSKSCYKREEDTFCKRNRPCNGALMDCQIIADGTVCLADEGTNRRYDYIQQEGKFLGHFRNCHASSVLSYTRWRKYFLYCDYCMYLCDEQGVNSDRYFSMRSSESDIHLNMVVTGLRFVKKNRIIHLQIQQGKLLPRAKIDVATVDWKPVEDYIMGSTGVVEGRDYHTLTLDKRGFDLDDVVVKFDRLVTGVRLRMTDSNLHLEIRKTHFNFTTGILKVEKSKWKHNNISRKDRKKVNLDNKDIPTLDLKPASLFSKPNMYLEFTHSDLRKDIAQTTLPFIDSQAVTVAQPVALSGAGVMHKGSTDYGGFITLKIMTYNYKNFFRNAYDHNYNNDDIYL